MASTYSDLKIELIGTGDQSGTWGITTNSNLGNDGLGAAIAGSADVTFSSADVTVTLTDSIAAQTARNLRLNLTGTTGGARNLILGSGCQIEKPYLINNGTADTITVKNTTGTGIAVPAGKSMWVYNNGTNVVDAVTHLTSLTLGSALPIASGGTGSTSTTFVNLATNVTGDLPFSNLTQGSALSVLGVTGNATADVASIAAGTDNQVLRRSGTSVAFGAVNLASTDAVTGALPVANGGTGSTSTTFVNLATNVTGTLPVANGGTGATTLTANNVILGNGTSAVQFVAPGSNGNVLTSNGTTWTSSAGAVGNVTTSGNNAFTGANTFYNATGQTFAPASTNDGIIVLGRAGGSSSYRVTLAPTTLSASRTLTLPDATGTVLTTATAVTVAQGGTGATSLTANNVLLGNGTSALQVVAPGASGNLLTSDGTTWTSTAPSGGVNFQAFTSSGTWTKPSGATIVLVQVWGGGGGGGSGRRGAAASSRFGGGGGGGGASYFRFFRASELGATETVTVGAGGTGGAAVTVDSTNGNAGTAGGTSSFGTYLYAYGGGGGSFGRSGGGDLTGGGGGTAGAGFTPQSAISYSDQALGGGSPGSYGYASVSGGSVYLTTADAISGGGANSVSQGQGNGEWGGGSGGSQGGSSPNSVVTGGSSLYGGSGGGLGGGINTVNTASNGGAGGSTSSYTGGGGASGGAAGGTAGTAGSQNANTASGGGGGGGGGNSAGAGGAGGAGGTGGGGGGGGGASVNGSNSGAGGAGGNGYVRIFSW